MYSRNQKNRYTPPPGYVGSVFSESQVKHHKPEEVHEPAPLPRHHEHHPSPQPETHEGRELADILRRFKDRIGFEEVVILTVMYLVATEGQMTEFLILALILIAG